MGNWRTTCASTFVRRSREFHGVVRSCISFFRDDRHIHTMSRSKQEIATVLCMQEPYRDKRKDQAEQDKSRPVILLDEETTLAISLAMRTHGGCIGSVFLQKLPG